jgi:hypothetical protein
MPRLVLRPLALTALLLCSCKDLNPPPRPEADCQVACERQAPRCSEHECARGCGFILDRLVEHESAPVLACVAARAAAWPPPPPTTTPQSHESACNDPVWADCAAAVGVHADGGPPAPQPAKD